MKVLLVTTKHSIFDVPFREAFQASGVELKAVDYRGNKILMPGTLPHKIVRRLPDKIRRLILSKAQKKIDEAILSAAKSYRPDLVFILKAKEISKQTLRELREIAVTANWYPETFDHWETIKSIAPEYDLFFNYDPVLVQELKNEGIHSAHYLPFSAFLVNSVCPDLENRKYDIAFIGSFMAGRYSQRETILAQLKDLDLNIWGNKAWLDTSLKDYYRGRPDDEEMLNIYRSSKIVVNIDLMLGVKGTGVNLRPFEVTSCGALLLNHDDRKDIFNLFQEGTEFVSFKGPEDVKEKVEYYLRNPEKLKQIAKAGFEKTLSQHTYQSRVKTILSLSKELKSTTEVGAGKIKCSVGVLTLNSGKTLRRALESVKDFDEIIICDGNSTDNTLDIAREFGAKIIKQYETEEKNIPAKDFSEIRNKCLDAAKNDWFFYIDSDESVSKELVKEIREITSRTVDSPLIYKIPSRIIYKDREIKYSTSYPGYQTRFFNKRCGGRFKKKVHERLEFNPNLKVGVLNGPWYVFASDEDDFWKDTKFYVAKEVAISRKQNFGQFLKWSIYKRLERLAKIVIKASFIYIRHGFRDSMPVKFEFQRFVYAFYLMIALIKDRIGF